MVGAAGSGAGPAPAHGIAGDAPNAPALTVYASPACGCCAHWVSHLERHGLPAETVRTADMASIKETYGIGPSQRSCHTAVSRDGHVFEGHIPARYIRQFLADPPAGAIGLTVPGMPAGSPGMEMGDRFTPYDVLVIREDGSTAVFAEVAGPAQQ